jgi:hypothetical protein
VQGDSEGRPDRAGADDPDDRPAVVGRPDVRVSVGFCVDDVTVPVGARGQLLRRLGSVPPKVTRGGGVAREWVPVIRRRPVARERRSVTRERLPVIRTPGSHRHSPRYS